MTWTTVRVGDLPYAWELSNVAVGFCMEQFGVIAGVCRHDGGPSEYVAIRTERKALADDIASNRAPTR